MQTYIEITDQKSKPKPDVFLTDFEKVYDLLNVFKLSGYFRAMSIVHKPKTNLSANSQQYEMKAL
jgi:hypothetical protein